MTERNLKNAEYRTKINIETLETLKKQVIKKLLFEGKYKDKAYSANKLAKDLNTNSRYISATINHCFKVNYNELVNKYRIDEAKLLLQNSDLKDLNIDYIAKMVGFSSSQSFYVAFKNLVKATPLKYRKQFQNK